MTTRTLVQIQLAFKQAGYQSRSAGYKACHEGLLPAPIRVGKASTLPSDELQAIIDARVAGHSDEQIRALVDQLMAARKSLRKGPDMDVKKLERANEIRLTLDRIEVELDGAWIQQPTLLSDAGRKEVEAIARRLLREQKAKLEAEFDAL